VIVVLMGPAGAGKTTVGKALANALAWAFVDADTLHPDANVEKIRSGHPLTEADRQPWLARTREAIVSLTRDRTHAVMACSALRERHRLFLAAEIPSLRWVFLHADRDLLEKRLRERAGHFAGREILDSQLRDLEPPRHELTLPAQLPVDALVDTICTELGLTPIRSRQVLG
jgi:gluconokinase